MNDSEIRMKCIEFAMSSGAHLSNVLMYAKEYYTWVMEGGKDSTKTQVSELEKQRDSLTEKIFFP